MAWKGSGVQFPSAPQRKSWWMTLARGVGDASLRGARPHHPHQADAESHVSWIQARSPPGASSPSVWRLRPRMGAPVIKRTDHAGAFDDSGTYAGRRSSNAVDQNAFPASREKKRS
jgi:hypothetical protein